MSEKKHTPGEWFTHREGHSTVYVECRIGGGLIQAVAACRPNAAGREQQEANARLIAAAPELLEALQGILSCVSVRIDDPRIEKFDAARAAIAKATGEQA